MYYVYRFLDKEGNVIYIGKANKMSSRMSGHNHLPEECYNSISKIEYIEINNHSEGSIYEIYNINKYSPKYNVVDNRRDSIEFELPEKEWKSWNGKIKYKEQESKEIMKKVKQHEARGDIVTKTDGIYYVCKKETIDKNKHRYETLLNNSYMYYDYDSLFEALFYHKNNSEVCRSDNYYYNKNLKYKNDKVSCGKFIMWVDYDKIFVCYNNFNNEIFIYFGQEDYITLDYKGIEVEKLKNIINGYEGCDRINFKLKNYEDGCFCEEIDIISLMEEFKYLVNNKEETYE